MKQVKVKIETTVETMLGDKPVNEVLGDIADICHTSLEYSTSKNEGCETLYEDQEYEDYRNDMEDRCLYQYLFARHADGFQTAGNGWYNA